MVVQLDQTNQCQEKMMASEDKKIKTNSAPENEAPPEKKSTSGAEPSKASAPPRVSEEEALRASGPDAVYYATRLRGASNEKAARELEFRPRPLEWILGQRSD
jgi:hypothetical protein